MATGFRIMSTDASLAGKTVVVQDHSRRMGHNGEPKTYPIPLDDTAAAVVSERVWERLQVIMATSPSIPRFVLVNAVPQPKTMVAAAGVGAAGRPSVLLTPGGGQVDLKPLQVPASF